MTHESLTNEDWDWVVERLGGAWLKTKAFVRARAIRNPIDLLRLTLAYCLGNMGLRSAWAEALGLASVSDVALLGRFRCRDWLLDFLRRNAQRRQGTD